MLMQIWTEPFVADFDCTAVSRSWTWASASLAKRNFCTDSSFDGCRFLAAWLLSELQ